MKYKIDNKETHNDQCEICSFIAIENRPFDTVDYVGIFHVKCSTSNHKKPEKKTYFMRWFVVVYEKNKKNKQ